LRGVAREIALAVGLAAQAAVVAPPTTPDELKHRVSESQWVPAY
jgi:hypothetical protein